MRYATAMNLRKVKPTDYSERYGLEKPDTKSYPTINLSLKDFPTAKDWDVGEEYVITMKVRQSAISQNKGGKGNVTFEILGIGGESDEDEENEDESSESAEEEESEKKGYSRVA